MKYTEGAEEIVAVSGFGTHSEKSAAHITPTEKGVERMIDFAIEKGHSSLLDFPYYVLTIEGVSRSFTHQWVRYRMAAHLQQSLRYVQVHPDTFDWFVTPPTILEQGANAIIDYIRNQQAAGEYYKSYVAEGIPKEDARFGLPIGTKTHISSAFNAEEYLHIIAQRTCLDAQWEIRSVANAILLAGMIVHPTIFKKAGAPCITRDQCVGEGEGKCKEEVRELKNTLLRMSKEKREEFATLDDGEELTIDLTETLGYTVPEEVSRKVTDEFNHKINLDWNVNLRIRKNWVPEVKEA